MTEGSTPRSCNRCGEPAVWLVARPYTPQAAPSPGRLFVYCEACRRAFADSLNLVLSLQVLDASPDQILTLLYQNGVTRTAPLPAAETIGVAPGLWVTVAQDIVK